MKIQDIRQEFPALQQQVFLDSACVSLAPRRAVETLRAFLDKAAYCPSGSSTQHHLDHDFVDDARRCETGGTANYPGASGLADSVGLINDIGIENVSEHVLSLTDSLIAGLKQQNIQVVTPQDRRSRSGIGTFTLGEAEYNIVLTNFLQEHKVLVSVLYTSGVGGVRVSCHLFNIKEDLDRLLNLTRTYLRQHAKATA